MGVVKRYNYCFLLGDVAPEPPFALNKKGHAKSFKVESRC